MATNVQDTRTGQVMHVIRDRIERRTLTPGARLPSVRAMAETIGFSKSTVVEAYDRLAADGTIRSRPGSGFYVASPLAPLALDRLGSAVEREVDPLWMLRQSLANQLSSEGAKRLMPRVRLAARRLASGRCDPQGAARRRTGYGRRRADRLCLTAGIAPVAFPASPTACWTRHRRRG